MDTIKCKSLPNNKTSKIARKFQKVISLKNATTKIASTNSIGICILASQNHDTNKKHQSNLHDDHDAIKANKRRAVLDALIAKVFAGVTTIKASYAELQLAQYPYSTEAIQAADQAIVDELKQLSELKRSFLKNDLHHLSPQVTVMLAEIQEQQSLMRTYEITVKKLEGESETKEASVAELRKQLEECVLYNKSLEKKLNASGHLSIFDTIQFSSLNQTHITQCLQLMLRSIKSFVKLMVRLLEFANWDIEAASKAIEPDSGLVKTEHQVFLFESFVSKTMLEGFHLPNFANQSREESMVNYFNEFKRITKTGNIKGYVIQNPSSRFAKFVRGKYVQLVHAKMECSLFGNLNQRKLLNSGGYPESEFFATFVEMARRVWAFNLLAFSFSDEVGVFQVRKNSRFSEVYMESVTEESLLVDGAGGSGSDDLRVAFTVVPGFKIGNIVIQSHVYLSPAVAPVSL